jgi:uncharacterized membrane protein
MWLVACAFAFACNGVVSRRCAVVHGTPTGPRSSFAGASPRTVTLRAVQPIEDQARTVTLRSAMSGASAP